MPEPGVKFTVLGCGSSPGTPRPNGDWGACDPQNPRNRRMRASLLVERFGENGTTTVVIDTGPDFRAQMIMAGVGAIDAVVYTHPHADHIHGIDDLRTYVQFDGRRMPIFADRATLARMREGFGYCFQTPHGSSYPPILDPIEITHERSFAIEGKGGSLTFKPLLQQHGSIHSLGYRIGDLAYCADVSGFAPQTLEKMRDLKVLIIDALQYRGHSSHLSLPEALEIIEFLAPERAVLTHMHTPLDYETVRAETPDNVEPAYDGMELKL